jgi:carboxymethylenebutenolidase
MIEQQVEIATPDGIADGYLFARADGARQPGVLHLTDIRGVRPAVREMARRLAGAGYTVLLPNVFYRTRRPPLFDFPFQWGDERTAKRFAELTGPLTPDAVEHDASGYVDFLAAHRAVSPGAMAVVGYCATGAMALRIAAARRDHIAAAASFHGGGLWTDDPASPHLVLPRVKARLLFAHADGDRSMPADAIANFDAALAKWGGYYESEVYAGASHGWTVPDNASYNASQAERAYAKLTALLAETLARS